MHPAGKAGICAVPIRCVPHRWRHLEVRALAFAPSDLQEIPLNAAAKEYLGRSSTGRPPRRLAAAFAEGATGRDEACVNAAGCTPTRPRDRHQETDMPTYIVLGSFTDQGIRGVKDTTKRADAVKEHAKKFGVTAKEFYWTLGAHDMVVILDAPDDAAMSAFGMSVGSAGNVRTQTMRAFSKDEVNAILGKLG
jgi:uncharacterized protein with GYD domain